MDENLHDIDHIFQEGIEGRTEAPPARIWDSLSAKLDAEGEVRFRRKYQSLKRVSLLLLLLLCGSVGYIIVDGFMEKTAEEKGIAPLTELNGKQKPAEAEAKKPIALPEPGLKEGMAAIMKPEAGYQIQRIAGPSQNNLLNSNPVDQVRTGSDPDQQFVSPASIGIEALDGIVSHLGSAPVVLGSQLKSSSFHFISASTLPLKKATIRKPEPKGRFSIQPYLSFGSFNHQRLEADRKRYREDDRGAIKEKEHPGFVLNAGVLAEYRLGKRLGIHTGLVYMRQSILIQPKKLYARQSNNGNVAYRFSFSSGYAYFNAEPGSMPMPGDSANTFKAENLQHYLSFPIGLSYGFGKGKLSFRANAGFSANVLLRASIATTVEDGMNKSYVQTTRVEGVTPLYYNAYFGFGTEYALSQRLRLSLQPQYSIAFSSKTKDAPVKTYPNSLGLGLGLRVGL